MLDVQVELHRPRFRLQAGFSFSAGAMGIFGPSGAGKSSLLHVIAGLIRPQNAEIKLGQRYLVSTTHNIFEPAHRRRVGLVFQDSQLLPHLNVAQNLEFGRRLSRSDGRQFTSAAIVGLLALQPLLKAMPKELSGGEKQRVALGRALLASPELLLLDEPMASLDHGMRKQILTYLRQVRDELKLPMIYVSHSIGEIVQLCDSVAVLHNGRISQCGNTETVFAQSSVVGFNNVLRVRVLQHDLPGGCTAVDVEGSQLIVPLNKDLSHGDYTFITIDEQDIAIATHPVEGISIQNQLVGYVLSIANSGGRVQIGVDVGPLLWTEITARALARLNLVVGDQVWCLIKTQSVRYLDE